MNNAAGQFDRDIKMEEEKYKRLKQLYLSHKQELNRVERIAERYQPTLEMPEFREPPEGYRRQFGTLSMKNIINNVPKFDPDNEHGKFSYTWQAILQFGRLEYFNEEEYKQVLSTVLQGPAQDKAAHSSTCWTHLQTSMLQETQSKKTRRKWTTSQGRPRNLSVQQ
jgi:hypothetical protein